MEGLDVISRLLAAAHGEKICAIHEQCLEDGCPGRQTTYEAIRSPTGETLIMKESPEWTGDSCSTTRDAKWVTEQGFEDFNYAAVPLSEGMIRLLSIKAATFTADVIECEMVIMPLDEAKEFNALSYTWGKPIFDAQILCNGHRLAIANSLEQTLRVYRRSLGVFNERPLWVDAVCIDQSNIRERNAQILLMQRIYASATTVMVDLGEADHTWALGFDVMIKCSRAHHLSDGYRPQEQSSYDAIFSSLPPPDHPAWTYYMNIYSSPWFRRTWILQEVAFAKTAQVRYGRFIFPWRTFAEAFTFFTKSRWDRYLAQRAASVLVHLGRLSVTSILEICDLSKQLKKQLRLSPCYASHETKRLQIPGTR
jgi:hypothetical protein